MKEDETSQETDCATPRKTPKEGHGELDVNPIAKRGKKPNVINTKSINGK